MKFIKSSIELLKGEFVKFCVVGGLGTVTDMGVFYILAGLADTDAKLVINLLPVPGYLLAVFQNYIINHFWTFKDKRKAKNISFSAFLKFLSVSLFSLIPRYIAYNIFLVLIQRTDPLILGAANFIGIIAGTFVNYFGSKYLVFKKKEEK